MIAPDEPKNEFERLKKLESYDILDSLSESDYDNLTAIAAEICDMPIALISLIDDKRQWFKSHHGIDISETPKELSFCAHAINQGEDVFVINDTRQDYRFHDNPLVTGDTKAVFYAGAPLVSKNGLPLGTLCVIDHKPNLLTKGQLKSLTALSNQVMNLLELRRNKFLLEKALSNLEEKNHQLERFASIAAHDLKSPLMNISSLAQIFLEEYKLKIDEEGVEVLELIISSSSNLMELVNGLLAYSKSDSFIIEEKSIINLKTLKEDIVQHFNSEHNINMVLNSPLETITINKTAIHHILLNLVSNAVKYSDKPVVDIELNINITDTYYKFSLTDNGPGIALENQEKMFKLFEKLTNTDKFGQPGHGIGLAAVKKIVERFGGEINVKSDLGKGATFNFTIKK